MKVLLIFLFIIFMSHVKCGDIDSYEINRMELTPLHDAIIFNDIADILSEFENSMNSQLNNHVFSNSESEEDIENLLTDYQQYLDKAHKQRVNYIRKTKGKNKVPVLRQEKFSKLKPIKQNNYDENTNYYYDNIKHPTVTTNALTPHISKFNFVKNTALPFDLSKGSWNDKNTIDLPTKLFENPSESIISNCFCKENVIPCKCESVFPNNFNKMGIEKNLFTNNLLKTLKYIANDKPSNILDNYLNLRIKIDIRLPNILIAKYLKLRYQDRTEEYEDTIPKEIISTLNSPFPYINFPIPIQLIGYKQNQFKDKLYPVNKITIHKKKKFHSNNNNKKHRNKKLFTLHNFKFEPQQNISIEHNNNSEIFTNNSFSNKEDEKVTNFAYIDTMFNYTNIRTTISPNSKNVSNQSFKTIYLTVNISKENDNRSKYMRKIANSIESDFGRDKSTTTTTTKLLRLKRETANKLSTPLPINNQPTLSQVKFSKNLDKETESDSDLLYWPSAENNQTLIHSKNITALILDREIKKVKLNMTQDKIRNDHTKALEKAIFGDVDWNDVDAVVPIFISFVGKYITGVLTFCSQKVCHSMKCEKKICSHRICTPENRYKFKGHCAGNNDTDSVATMESIMDLPSNIASEVVDILEENMLGKLFGKGTLCINSKCSAFAVFKKKFMKSRCTFKELNPTGHCPNLKNVKII